MAEAVINFRLAEQGDLSQISDIEKQDNPYPWKSDSFKAALNNDAQQLWVLEISPPQCQQSSTPTQELHKPQIVAYLVGMLVIDEASLLHINVARIHRRNAYAESLIRHWLLNLKYDQDFPHLKVWLEVRAANTAAINLYAKLGFVEQGIRKAYYSSPSDDAFIMNLISV